jgi:hypothetical protein
LWNPRAWWRQPADGGFTLLIWAVTLAHIISVPVVGLAEITQLNLRMLLNMVMLVMWQRTMTKLAKVVSIIRSKIVVVPHAPLVLAVWRL